MAPVCPRRHLQKVTLVTPPVKLTGGQHGGPVWGDRFLPRPRAGTTGVCARILSYSATWRVEPSDGPQVGSLCCHRCLSTRPGGGVGSGLSPTGQAAPGSMEAGRRPVLWQRPHGGSPLSPVDREGPQRRQAAPGAHTQSGGPVRLRPAGEFAQHRCRGTGWATLLRHGRAPASPPGSTRVPGTLGSWEGVPQSCPRCWDG